MTIYEAIASLDQKIVTVVSTVQGKYEAFDADGNEIKYDIATAETKLAEMQAAEEVKAQAQADAKASALAKLAKLGLTPEEVQAILG